MGARPWIALAQYVQAELLLDSDRPADRDQALALLDRALAIAHAVGMTRLAEQVRSLKASLGDVPDRDSRAREGSSKSYPDGLTAREVEVLRLIATGHTSQEIAAALVVSVATVHRHISNLYAKIGARGRADATAYALTHALVPARLT